MISLYSGTPGSGKSLHIASRIYNRLKRGFPTICNFDVNLNKISKKYELPFVYIPNNELEPKLLIDISKDFNRKRGYIKEDSVLLVLDECQIIFNSRSWMQKGRDQWLSFFSQHRKYGYEIVLIAQYDGMIDKQIRSLIEYNIIHRKVSNFGFIGKIISALALGKMFCGVKMWYPLNERIDSEFFIARKKYYQIYDTYAFFDEAKKIKGK